MKLCVWLCTMVMFLILILELMQSKKLRKKTHNRSNVYWMHQRILAVCVNIRINTWIYRCLFYLGMVWIVLDTVNRCFFYRYWPLYNFPIELNENYKNKQQCKQRSHSPDFEKRHKRKHFVSLSICWKWSERSDCI